MSDQKPRALTVLGMHRSGTGALMSCLADSGCYVGDVGHNWERPPVWRFHENRFKRRGEAWHTVPIVRDVLLDRDEVRTLEGLLDEFQPHDLWATKDPRMLFFFPYWYERVEFDCLGIFRHPDEVAISLERRNEFPRERGLSLWTAYNDRLLRLHATFGFPIFHFNEEPTRLVEQIRDVLSDMGLSVPDRFSHFDPAGKKRSAAPESRSPSKSWSESTRRVYERLLEAAHSS